MRARTWLQTCLLGLSLLASSGEAHASLVQAMDLSELTEAADLVAVGRVIGQWSHFDDEGRIVTDVQVQVEEISKGAAAPGASIIVRNFGGVVGGVGMRIEGEASFADGDEVLLFGSQLAGHVELRPVGMSQGAMQVYEQAGERWVRSMAAGVSLVRKQASGGVAPATPVLSEPRRLADVLSEIQGHVAKSSRRTPR